MNGQILISRLLLPAVGILFLVAGVAAAQSKDMTPEELTGLADVVAVGLVTDLRPEWTPDHTRIVTHVTISVDQFLKGSVADNALTVTVPGGEIGDVGESYSHSARFAPQEAVVVFANHDARGGFRVVAGDRGKMTVSRDLQTGQRIVREGLTLEVLQSRVATTLRSGTGR